MLHVFQARLHDTVEMIVILKHTDLSKREIFINIGNNLGSKECLKMI